MSSHASGSNTLSDSFTEMDPTDLESIGAHCAFCRQKDFLPFRCESCGDKFCLEHRTESSHYCPKEGAYARARAEAARADTNGNATAKPTIYNHDSQCADPKCRELLDVISNIGVHCTTCNRRYCWKHRMPEDHDCKNLIPIGARPTYGLRIQRDKGIAALAKLRLWGAEKKAGLASATVTAIPVKPSSARLKRQKTNELKQTAKGEAKWKEESRIYVWLIGATDAPPDKWPRARAFYPGEFNAGRILDLAAKDLKMANHNNRISDETQKLRVFHLKERAAGGKLLSFDSDKPLVSQGVQTGHTLVVFKGTVPPIADIEPLMEM